ncbi:hypothetical protein CBL_00497 [Carabus blaptoides fortunei]
MPPSVCFAWEANGVRKLKEGWECDSREQMSPLTAPALMKAIGFGVIKSNGLKPTVPNAGVVMKIESPSYVTMVTRQDCVRILCEAVDREILSHPLTNGLVYPVGRSMTPRPCQSLQTAFWGPLSSSSSRQQSFGRTPFTSSASTVSAGLAASEAHHESTRG